MTTVYYKNGNLVGDSKITLKTDITNKEELARQTRELRHKYLSNGNCDTIRTVVNFVDVIGEGLHVFPEAFMKNPCKIFKPKVDHYVDNQKITGIGIAGNIVMAAAAMAYALHQNADVAKTLHKLNYELITNFGEMSCIEFILTTEDGAFTISPTGQKVFVSKDDEAGLIIGTGRLPVNYTTIEEEGEHHLNGCSSAVYKTWFDEKTIRELASKDENTGGPWKVLKVN